MTQRQGSPDARVVKTRQRLAAALVTLTLERGYDTVTVRELTARAGVGYATFFRHFASKEALLEHLLTDTLDDLMVLLTPRLATSDLARIGTLVFGHARDHADRYRVLLRTGEITGLLERCTQLSTDTLSATFIPKPGSVVPFEVAARHLVHSFTGLVAWYLDTGLPYSPERIGEILEALILEPTYRVALEVKRDA